MTQTTPRRPPQAFHDEALAETLNRIAKRDAKKVIKRLAKQRRRHD